MQIFTTLSPNFWEGRTGEKPEAFVIHVTEGNFTGAVSWCQDPASQVSYHFIVRDDGVIFKLVEDINSAWHAGLAVKPTWKGLKKGTNPNLYTIGIAFAGFAAKGPTLAQILAIRELIESRSIIYKIPIDRLHVIGHNEIRTDKICPGPLMNLEALVYICSLM